LLLAPLLLLATVAVKLSSPGPILFRQERVGRGGRRFLLLKFRSMRIGAESQGALVTGSGDARVTPVGRWLRRTKLDELPQLWNVVRGDMSLVGPRPEVPRYVAHYTAGQRRVLEVRPGITDPATLAFRNEEQLLGSVPVDQRESFYINEILPRKLEINLEYLAKDGVAQDLAVLLRTVAALLGLAGAPGGDSA